MTTGRINQVTSLKDDVARAPRLAPRAQDEPRASFLNDNGHRREPCEQAQGTTDGQLHPSPQSTQRTHTEKLESATAVTRGHLNAPPAAP